MTTHSFLFKNPISIISFIVVALSFIDSVVISLYLASYHLRSSDTLTILFISFITVYGVSILVIIKSVVSNKLNKTSKTKFNILKVFFLAIFSLFSISIFQMIVFKEFSLIIYETIVFTCYLFSIIIFSLLFKKLLSWFKLTKNFFILCYLIAIASFVLAEIFVLIKIFIESTNDPLLISPVRNPWASYSSTDIIFSNLVTFSILSTFIILWFTTIIFLRNYTDSLGKYTYIILIILPLVYFLGPLDSNYFHILHNLGIFNPYILYILNTFIFGAIRQVGGIFFAIAFFVLIRNLKNEKLKFHILVAGMGIILFFSCNQSFFVNNGALSPI